jgi:hypothetical protein
LGIPAGFGAQSFLPIAIEILGGSWSVRPWNAKAETRQTSPGFDSYACGITVVLNDKPENILERITFYDIDSRPIARDLTTEEKRLYLSEIKQDITYFRKTYERAHLRVDISDLNPQQAARRVRWAVNALKKSPREPEESEQIDEEGVGSAGAPPSLSS